MSEGSFQNATCVLIGHGSTLNAESADPVFQHSDTIKASGHFARVIECFWKLEPSICAVPRVIDTDLVFYVPLFISDGYFTEEVIPRELGFDTSAGPEFERVMHQGNHTAVYCRPIGTHSSMTQVIEKRALDILEKHPFPHKPEAHDVSLFIAGHGTGNNVNSRKIIEEQAEIIRRSERFQNVHPVFMEEDPKIEDCYQLADTENIVMVPFFISDGLHSYEDIPMMLGAPEKVVRERYEAGQPTWPNPTEMHGKRVWYTASIGSEPHLPDVIMERIREAAEWLDKG